MDPSARGRSEGRSVVWGRSDGLAIVEVPTRVVLLHLDHAERPASILEGTSAAIWHAIDGHRDQSAIVEAVATEFGLAEHFIRDDVEHFLDELCAAELIVPASSEVEAE